MRHTTIAIVISLIALVAATTAADPTTTCAAPI